MIQPPFHTSLSGLEQIRSFESCQLMAYWDAEGRVWTIGWGSTGPDVHQGLLWTQSHADARFLQDVQRCEAEVNRCVSVPITQGEFDALVDFVYNLGDGALETSTMLRLLNDGDYAGAAGQFERWDHVHGKIIAGLLRRRIADKKEFNS